jgi:bifunctional non-homologous end joining protein LigD
MTPASARHTRARVRAGAPASPSVVAGITVTHPDRLLFPGIGLTKIELVRYFDAVADRILPHLAGRPLTLKQCAPDAEHCRYLRHSGERAPSAVRVVQIQEQKKVGDYMVVDTREALIALAQRNIVEFHTWNSRVNALERPDRLVFDLDPGPAVALADVTGAARFLRRRLDASGLDSWLKTTGGRGLHLVVPIVPEHDWAACLAFAKSVATAAAEEFPDRYSIRYPKDGRESKILIDYLRNNRTNTSVSAYSVRARPQATVSMPIAWDELTPRFDPSRWTVRTAPARLARTPDGWAGYFRSKQRLRL